MIWVERPGGGWLFMASPDNLKYQSPEDLTGYFSTVEKGNDLVLPQNPPRKKPLGFGR